MRLSEGGRFHRRSFQLAMTGAFFQKLDCCHDDRSFIWGYGSERKGGRFPQMASLVICHWTTGKLFSFMFVEHIKILIKVTTLPSCDKHSVLHAFQKKEAVIQFVF